MGTAGAPCGRGIGACVAGLACPGGSCVTVSPLGGFCDYGQEDRLVCAAPLACDAPAYTCKAGVGVGGACGEGSLALCGWRLVCEPPWGDAGVCVPQRP